MHVNSTLSTAHSNEQGPLDGNLGLLIEVEPKIPNNYSYQRDCSVCNRIVDFPCLRDSWLITLRCLAQLGAVRLKQMRKSMVLRFGVIKWDSVQISVQLDSLSAGIRCVA